MKRILLIALLVAAIAVCPQSCSRATAADVDLETLANQSAAEFAPITTEQFAGARRELIAAARSLERALGPSSILSHNWKQYLLWSRLEPHLDANVELAELSPAGLDRVLERFRANHPGLELPVFVVVANAIEKYRTIVTWVQVDLTRDSRAVFQQLLRATSEQLRRHAERPSFETGVKVGQAIGTLEAVGQSHALVDAVRERWVHPNLFVVASDRVVRRLGGRPVDNRQPVRDVILGTRIYGRSHTVGNVEFYLRPAADHVALEAALTGQTVAHTNGYNGPVVIRSRSTTDIAATSRVAISDAAFSAGAPAAWANTRAHILSICKTGGDVGRRLIEKIAWNRAGQQKRQSERIASQHAKVRVRNSYSAQLNAALTEARRNYEQRVRAPLIRQGAFPPHLRMSSTDDAVFVETTFAAQSQLGADGPPPEPAPGADFSLRIHQSAVGNYLAMAIGGATLKQDAADRPPELVGDIPPWLDRLTSREGVADDPVRSVDAATENDQTPFKPWTLTFNQTAPASIGFDDGRLIIRMRASQLASNENEFRNWDFIVRYRVAQRDNQVVLTRDGDIEVFPTDFDPEWDRRMSAQQSGLRNTLAKNLNARAEAGEGFPAEIVVDSITPPRLGQLELLQLQADDGWLALGWRVP